MCTGNTCRSPMAEGWLKQEFRRLGLDQEVEVSSCGVFARKGIPASFEADLMLKNEAIDITRHRSQPLCRKLIEEATHILAMSEEHEEAICELFPEAQKKIQILGIEDPIGRDFQVYKECFEKIKTAIKERWNWLVE